MASLCGQAGAAEVQIGLDNASLSAKTDIPVGRKMDMLVERERSKCMLTHSVKDCRFTLL